MKSDVAAFLKAAHLLHPQYRQALAPLSHSHHVVRLHGLGPVCYIVSNAIGPVCHLHAGTRISLYDSLHTALWPWALLTRIRLNDDAAPIRWPLSSSIAVLLQCSFEGAVKGRVIKHPTRAFAVEVTFYLDHPRLVKLGNQKPPPHFHPFQEEYFTMLEGEMALEIEGEERVLRPEDGEFCVKRWTNHRIYPPASAFTESGPKKAVCIASGEQSFSNFQLDFLFFENWYAYQDLLVVKGEKPDLIQIMSVSPHEGAGHSVANLSAALGRRRLVPVASMVVALWQVHLTGRQHSHRQICRCFDGLPAVLQEMEHGLVAGLRQDGEDDLPATICRPIQLIELLPEGFLCI